MTATDLSTALKPLLSIKALLGRAKVNDSSFYTASHRGTAMSSETRAQVAEALRETATELRAVAKRLDAVQS